MDNNFTCELCKMNYKTLNGYAKHIRQTHKTDESPLKKYNCGYCDKNKFLCHSV